MRNNYFIPVDLAKLPLHTVFDNPPNRVNFYKHGKKEEFALYFYAPYTTVPGVYVNRMLLLPKQAALYELFNYEWCRKQTGNFLNVSLNHNYI